MGPLKSLPYFPTSTQLAVYNEALGRITYGPSSSATRLVLKSASAYELLVPHSKVKVRIFFTNC